MISNCTHNRHFLHILSISSPRFDQKVLTNREAVVKNCHVTCTANINWCHSTKHALEKIIHHKIMKNHFVIHVLNNSEPPDIFNKGIIGITMHMS